MKHDNTTKKLQLDPRTKLLLLITVTTLMFSTGTEGMMGIIKLILSILPFLLLLAERQVGTAVKYLGLYLICYGLELIALHYLHGMATFSVMALTAIMTKFAPGIMVAAYLVSSTSVSEFIAAMERMHVTEKIVIPLSVIFRFLPTMKEEYQSIRDAMRMRNIRLGHRSPLLLLEYRLVPFMISLINIGDELSAAALTRGLGAPVRRTNLCRIGFHWQDALFAVACVVCLVLYYINYWNWF